MALDTPESGYFPLGVCVLPEPPKNCSRTAEYVGYVHDILTHAGVCYSRVSIENLPDALPSLRVLVTVGEATLPDDLAAKLRAWVEDGGAWLGVSGVCGSGDMFGIQVEPPAYAVCWGGGANTLGEGYLRAADSSHPVIAHLATPLHYFNGIPVHPAGGKVLAQTLDAHGRPSPRAAVVENVVGKGMCLLIAPDLIGSVVRVQQGVAVTRDGVPSSDGTAANCDKTLKSGDGGVLDWIFDREPVPGVPGLNAFLQPFADQWREMLLRAIFYLAARQNAALPVLWLYPRNLPALGILSHDTDGNAPSNGFSLLKVLEKAEINSTWCVIPPGYPKELIGAIREAGHELAMHYDAMSDGTVWSEREFSKQHRRLVKLFGGERPITNKNHYLRWEGDTEFYDWCVKHGIQFDQSKGATKTGEAGFNFGACHPYLPIDRNGETIDVLELPTITQDLLVFAPKELADLLLAAVSKHHGILHLLFHPAHIEKPGVAEALLDIVERAKRHGMEWWPACRINSWERARRNVCWNKLNSANVLLRTPDSLPGASILWLNGSDKRIKVNGTICDAQTVERWGFKFLSVTFDTESNREYKIEIADKEK